jgi:hypothetical protein
VSRGAAYGRPPRRTTAGARGTSISGSDPAPGGPVRAPAPRSCAGGSDHHEEVTMAKKARKKKARKKSGANHGKRPNS